MKYTKMHGAGNDFIIINNLEENIPLDYVPYIAKTLCQRRLSIGADGLMLVDKPLEKGDFKMYFYNSDGSLSEMCGNGARCIARYGYEKGLAGDIQYIETTAGMVTGWRMDKRQYKIRLNDVSKLVLDYDISVDGKKYKCSYVELGNPGLPHAVIEMKGLKDIEAKKLWILGNKLRNHSAFPKGANVNFYDICGEDQVEELTFERGVEDFTFACGTGTGSTVAVLTAMNKVSGNNVKVHMPGGELFVTADYDGNNIENLYLTGPTNIVAEGQVTDEDLELSV